MWSFFNRLKLAWNNGRYRFVSFKGVTRNQVAARQMHLWRGCFPILITEPKPVSDLIEGELWLQDVDFRIQRAVDYIKKIGFSSQGDNIVLLTGWRGGSGYTNTLRILECP